MKYNKSHVGIGASFVMAIILSASLFASPMALTNIMTSMQAAMPQIFNTAFAVSDTTHDIQLSAENLPNGQFAYKMIEHKVTSGAGTTDITSNYASMAVIPGPTLFVKQGDAVNVELVNNASTDVGFKVPGILNSNTQAAQGQTKSYSFTANTAGTFLYQDTESAMVGLFGAIVVDNSDGSVESYVDGEDGSLTPVNSSELSKQFVLAMVGSTFWGTEIASSGLQTPLWTNPTLGAELDELTRFHILSVGPGHTFHLHAHRWVDPGTTNIIDVKMMENGSDTHSFTVKAGDGVGAGDWQYHCHVFAHMEAGMHGNFKVYPAGPAPSIAGASPYALHPVVASILGVPASADPGLATFEISDEPGSWFRNTLDISSVVTTKSLALIRPGDSVNFVMSDTNTVHTITSLLWPTGAMHMPFDETTSYDGGGIVQLHDPGLYVFTCKVHPYMFGGVIVDDLTTAPVDLGDSITLATGLTVPTASDLATRLLRTFFIATVPENWQDYTDPSGQWHVTYPDLAPAGILFRVGTGLPSPATLDVDLKAVLESRYGNDTPFAPLSVPSVDGVGEVWIDTQFEKTEGKTKPGTATAVNATTWEVTKKIGLPEINMNNPHNMWTDKDQTVIYQTEWFDNKLTTFDRETGELVSHMTVGEAPSHVMTRTNNDDIHVALNGEEGVAEISATTSPSQVDRIIAMQGYGQDPTHPHAHWMSHDGQKMVTPNSFTGDSTLYGFDTGYIEAKPATGAIPIATGMTPDSSKYYVANLLSSTISVIDMSSGTKIKDINLLEDYNPLTIPEVDGHGAIYDGAFPLDSEGADGILQVGALPIQTPVSPDGEYMVTANTLSATITVVDVATDEVVTTLFCDAGCHGVQFGAKQGGGYYAYVSSKFSNAMIIVDGDPNNDGDSSDAAIVGRVSLVSGPSTTVQDDTVSAYPGMGGQGVLAIPNAYNGWVQNLPAEWKALLTSEQQNPVP